MRGSTRANFWLRTVESELTEGFAERHDTSVWRCLSNILGTPSAPDGAQVIATLGSRARTGSEVPPVVASWADALSMVRKRHSFIAESMIMHLEVGGVPCFQAVRERRELVEEAWLAVPSWAELSLSPLLAEEEPEPNQPRHSWQRKATRQSETRFVSDVVWPGLTDAREGVVEVPARTFGIGCFHRPHHLPGQPALTVRVFRILLWRRLHLPLPLSHRTVRSSESMQGGRRSSRFERVRARKVAALVWWSLAAEVGGLEQRDGAVPHSIGQSTGPRKCLLVLQGRAEVAWVRRWSAILACTAARSFSLSLLDCRPVGCTGDVVPSVHEVLREARFW